MSKTVSIALWIAGTMAIIGISFLILWPMIRGLLNDADNTRPTPAVTWNESTTYYATTNDMNVDDYISSVLPRVA